MEQKIKFIIIGLVSILLISLFATMQAISSKQSAVRERDTIKQENISLGKKVEEGIADNRRLQDKIVSLNQDLSRLSAEKDEIQKKYEVVDKSRQELVEELKTLKASGAEVPQTTDAYWAGVLKQKKDLEFQLEGLRQELKNVRINNEQVEREKSVLQLEVNSLNNEKQDLNRQYEFIQKQLDYNKKMMDVISLELVGEKNDKTKIQQTLKLFKNENTILRRQLRNLGSQKAALEKKIMDSQTKNDNLEKRFTEMDILLNDKMLQIDDLNKKIIAGGEIISQKSESVELSPIVVRPQQETVALALTGKVMAVNRENNFVVIDLGENAGVKVGDVFRVYKNNNAIATVEIIQVRKSISACDIRKETTPIRVGDIIK